MGLNILEFLKEENEKLKEQLKISSDKLKQKQSQINKVNEFYKKLLKRQEIQFKLAR